MSRPAHMPRVGPERSMLKRADQGIAIDAIDGSRGWRRARGEAALSDVHRTISVQGTNVRRLAAFLGPGYLVAVGYMDPGNWATSLAGGSKFGYTLLVVALISNVMAILLQALCARLGIAAGRDLPEACREEIGRAVWWERCSMVRGEEVLEAKR